MKIPINSIRKIMREITNEPIENKAIYLLVQNIEEEVKEITKIAIDLNNKRNKARIKSNLRIKKRLSEEILKEVLRNNNES